MFEALVAMQNCGQEVDTFIESVNI